MTVATDRPAPAGLSSAEAAARLAEAGPNVLPSTPSPSLAGRLLRHLAEPLSLLLLAAAVVSLAVLGETKEGLAILVIAALDALVGAVQEHRADRAVVALRQLTAPTARVRRDGRTVRVDAATVVPGDVVELAAGDRVPADVALVDAASFATDEAALTGESLPVEKWAPPAGAGGRAPGPAAGPGGSPSDRPGMAFAGTTAVRGRATGEVVATGAGTALGRLASSLSPPSPAPLDRELRRLGRVLTAVAVAVGTLLVPVVAVRSAGDDALAHALLAGVALAVAAIPEGLPAAVTAALALGARRMAATGGIVRRLVAIEALGSTGVLCVDKTGTLTTGRLSVQSVQAVEDRLGDLWAALVRCNDAGGAGEDPIDVAIMEAARARGAAVGPGRRLAEQPFDAATRLMAVIDATPSGPVLSVKGAPEAVLARCRPGPDTDAAADRAAALAADGLRVLAVADGEGDDLAATGLRPLGVVALADTVRDSARAAAEACRRAGIRLVMVTGDHRDTAAHVAGQVGIDTEPVVTGAELAAMDRAARSDALARAAVVARVEPSTKVDLVDAHRRLGRVVAMTGDGVN
ncbi:MAG TPA: HAD-IC family P-type ATPase, partial [Acidimicrobiales bacterium]|nr:HAD-IC family P-type ATPase [Acidimicrobiales bacterium]